MQGVRLGLVLLPRARHNKLANIAKLTTKHLIKVT